MKTIFDDPSVTFGARFLAVKTWANTLGWELARIPPYGDFVLSKQVGNHLRMVNVSYLGGVLSFLAEQKLQTSS